MKNTAIFPPNISPASLIWSFAVIFAVVDGLKSVLEYSENKIVFDIGKKSVAIHGSDLEIDYFTPQGAVVRGTIISLDFSQC